MSALSYIPRPRHLRRRGGQGWACVQCLAPFATRRGLWLHKVGARHPYIGNGDLRQHVTVTVTGETFHLTEWRYSPPSS